MLAAGDDSPPLERWHMDIARLLSKAVDEASVGRAFGPAIERDGTLVVPVAWVASGGGGGDDGGSSGDEGSGAGGGGFGTVTWPLGVYEVKDGRVRWVPAVDATRIALAAIGILNAIVRLRTLRRVKASKTARHRN